MQVQTVFKAGNSNVVAIPSDISREMGIKPGQKVLVEVGFDKNTLWITKSGSKIKKTSITPGFLMVLDGINKRYGRALSELARK